MLRRTLLGTVLFSFAISLVGCDPAEPAPSKTSPAKESTSENKSPKESPQRRIGLSILTSSNPFFVEVAESMKEAASQAGYEVITVSGDNDPNKQQNQVKDFITQKVAAIVLTPCDSRAVGTAIQEANEAGIPVFTADIASIAPNAKVVTHVATDNYSGGRQAAIAMIEALGGKGKVAIVDFPQVESVMLRTKGFREELDEQRKSIGIDIEIVATLPGDGAKDKSYKATQDLLQAHPDLNGIFAINDPSALGCYAAVENANMTDQIKIVGFDGQIDGKRAIRDGKIYADPIQFPKRIGTETVAAILKYLDGEDVPESILIPTELYRQSDGKADPSL
ncbi:MAG: substrate-binding domain-containing protein [Pirellula sp.]|jgi:ribose transport system substrate-binding protein|nr:substrate-binding domain-containing protein [Pirellula sp.]